MTNFGIVDLHSNGIHLEMNEIVIAQVKIPSDYVPHTFAAILGQHLLLSGDHLRNGMVVVVGEKIFRENPESLSPENPNRKRGFVPSEYDRASVEEQSRWALVTDLTNNGDIVKFTAIYSDGTMRARSYNQSIKWAILTEVEMLAVCPNCGGVHAEEDTTAKTVADDPEAQPFFDVMDATADLIGSVLFPDATSQAERIMSVKKSLREASLGIFDELRSIIEEGDLDPAEDSFNIKRGETWAEYQDRLRDEAEAAGEYNRDEKPKLSLHIVTPTNLTTEEDIIALRNKLMGQ